MTLAETWQHYHHYTRRGNALRTFNLPSFRQSHLKQGGHVPEIVKHHSSPSRSPSAAPRRGRTVRALRRCQARLPPAVAFRTSHQPIAVAPPANIDRDKNNEVGTMQQRRTSGRSPPTRHDLYIRGMSCSRYMYACWVGAEGMSTDGRSYYVAKAEQARNRVLCTYQEPSEHQCFFPASRREKKKSRNDEKPAAWRSQSSVAPSSHRMRH